MDNTEMSVDNPEQKDELRNKLVSEMTDAFHIKHQDGAVVEVKDVWAYVEHKLLPFIKAQASKDMAEVIGEDEIGFNKYGSMCDHDQHLEIKHFNELRAQQRKTAASKGYKIGGLDG